MENQEYVIKGTVEGMIKILQNDFDMSYEEAKFFVYIMINQHSGEAVNAVDQEELDTWYLMTTENKYEGQIFNTHLVINFTNIRMSLCRIAYMFFVNFFFSRGIDLVLIGAELVYAVVTAIKKIRDTDYCVYARIVELCIGNQDRFFEIDDIVNANREGKCDFQGDDWQCVYLGNDDDCTCNEQHVRLAFANLTEQNVIREVGDRWMLVR